MDKYEVGMKVKYKVNDFDCVRPFIIDCIISEVGEDYAVAIEMNEFKPMRLRIDADTEYMFNKEDNA